MTTDAKLFSSTSPSVPSLLNVSFQDDPKGSLGVTLVNTDKKEDSDRNMFLPAYAVVGKLLEGDETVAKKAGVQVGDQLVAVNGHGFRRFKPDYSLEDAIRLDELDITLDHAVVEPGSGYDSMLKSIKAIKAGNSPETLVLSFERYGWDERPNSWQRFLQARDNHVIDAMTMIQQHEVWKQQTFPIPLQSPGLQHILRAKAVSEIDVATVAKEFPPTVYVHYAKLLEMQTAGDITPEDVVQAFVIFTERMLAKASDPRAPKTCQFIDLTDVSLSSGFRVDTLKLIYNTFEPNYPETLFKMVVYPVSSVVATTAKTMLSFVNARTQAKFLITNSLEKVCQELGWDQAEVEQCGGVTEFMHKHEKAGTSMIFD